MKLLLLAAFALALTACQGRVRYRGTAPNAPAAEAAAPAPKADPVPAATPAPAPASSTAQEPDAKAKRLKWAQDEAARLIRESVPLTLEVADGVEKSLPSDRRELENLRTKAKTAHENLSAARELYLRIELDADNQGQLQDRIRKLNDLIATMKGALKRIDSAL